MSEMDIAEAMKARHSVRKYTDRKIEGDVKRMLEDEIAACNAEGNLHMQLITDEDGAFGGLMSHASGFSNARNYIAMVGPRGDDLETRIGYYGERIVLRAQQIGLNTCWAAGSFNKKKAVCDIGSDEEIVLGIAVGYGAEQGAEHKSKAMSELCSVEGDMPDWFKAGMEAAMLAPTGMNQQKFMFTLKDGKVSATAKDGRFTKVDLGIAKCNFEYGAGSGSFEWA